MQLNNYFLAGGLAGLTVDAVLFPLDTLKTRLQSKEGWLASGGNRRLYSGLTSTLLGSGPSAALFFFSYECMKRLIGENRQNAFTHSISSSLSEVVACSVRVPVEIVKQRMQVGVGGEGINGYNNNNNNNVFKMVKNILKSEGGWGLYRGFTATIQREIPFAAIQFPVYEALKGRFAQDDKIRMALCGSTAGGLTAFLTTPLDVLKTRTMLNPADNPSLRRLWNEGGLRCLFAGAVPRVMWVSIGGFVFFGVYEKVLAHLKE